ncbi:Asp-tRNAAsn/Glu-tRNAGln amidotransferase B subunit [Moorella thermoacetica Y72]|uniref:Asp-tRNAAsn/Glu-tRNAGln amidotransferase B subunit n=1 Tax=Moorella thermoacetica Y72 TaxID=1325331 RepID=A0A0S6UHM8_NEOTH|nr:Asp-tRNAAsn/Glu-tRNAGln amidotransferase B subunit [Moorella thermoacetica Y72]
MKWSQATGKVIAGNPPFRRVFYFYPDIPAFPGSFRVAA